MTVNETRPNASKSIENLLSTTLDTRSRADILVNCAGVNSSIPYEEIPDDDVISPLRAENAL